MPSNAVGRSSAAPVPVPEPLEPFVEKLADLESCRAEAGTWDVLRQSSGIVSFGGNAVEDTNAIDDG